MHVLSILINYNSKLHSAFRSFFEMKLIHIIKIILVIKKKILMSWEYWKK